MTKLAKITLSTMCLTGMLCATMASAVDQAAAAGDLANISTISVQAKADLAAAALAGDVDAIAEAGKRADAVDLAVAQAAAAYATLETELANGNDDAAQSAADDLKAAVQNATDALKGVITQDVVDAAKKLKQYRTSAGGPGRPNDPPNMYDVPWNSQAMRDFYQSNFGNFWMSGVNPPDREATPE